MSKSNSTKSKSYLSSLQLLVVLLAANSFHGLAQASSSLGAQQDFARQFASQNLVFPDLASPCSTGGSYPVSLRFLLENFLSWIPTGEAKELSPECDPQTLMTNLKKKSNSAAESKQGQIIQEYFDSCNYVLRTQDLGFVANFRKMLTMKLSPQKNPLFNRVVLQLPGDVKVKGFLALKGDNKPRPMVVLRLGIYSGVEDFQPEKAWAMMLFEQSPFNVLLVENMTSSDFIKNNKRFSFGGYDEGIQNIQIAKILKNPREPLAKIVSSLHLFGVSLGGHGTLFTSLLNNFNRPANGVYYNSFLAMCPVVDLKKSMAELTKPGTIGVFADLWSRRRLSGIKERIPGFQEQGLFSFLPSTIDEVVKTYQGGLSYTSDIKLPPGMKNSSDFWALNDFWKSYKNIKEPVFIFATQKDPMVPYIDNSKTILERKIGQESKNLNVVELQEGYHCTLPISYDWHTQQLIYKSYILSQSPEFKLNRMKLPFYIPLEEAPEAKNFDQVHFRALNPKTKKSFVPVQISFLKAQKELYSFEMHLPISDLDFKLRNENLTDEESEMLVRWINANLMIKAAQKADNIDIVLEWDRAL